MVENSDAQGQAGSQMQLAPRSVYSIHRDDHLRAYSQRPCPGVDDLSRLGRDRRDDIDGFQIPPQSIAGRLCQKLPDLVGRGLNGGNRADAGAHARLLGVYCARRSMAKGFP